MTAGQEPKTCHPDDVDDKALGRAADSPREIPRTGWFKILKRVWSRVSGDNLSLVAAGVAFYALLALFPGIAALISLFGLVADPVQVESQFSVLVSFLPADAYELIREQMLELTSRPDESLGIGLVSAILLSVWSATRGTKSLMMALNIAYDEQEQRGFIKLNMLGFSLTFFLVMLAVVVLALIVAVPIVLDLVGLGYIAELLVQWSRWPVLAMMLLITLALIYRYGPSRRPARWRWVSAGSVFSVVVWLAASALFSFYVAEFGNYNATYGSVGAVIVLLMWLYISALITILGAAINAEMERQTARDTTRGGVQPRGQRGAYVADHLPGEDASGSPSLADAGK